MRLKTDCLAWLGLTISLASCACAAKAATISTQMTVCGSSVLVPHVQPPPGSAPVLLMAVPCVQSRNGEISIPRAYQQYVQLKASRPDRGVWIPYDARAKATMEADYRRLWETGKFDELSINVEDYTFENGVQGKFVTYVGHER